MSLCGDLHGSMSVIIQSVDGFETVSKNIYFAMGNRLSSNDDPMGNWVDQELQNIDGK